MDTTPLLIQDTEASGGRHAASRWAGLRLGTASFVLSLGPVLWVLAMYSFSRGESVTLGTAGSLAFLGSWALVHLGMVAAVVLGIIAIRKNRVAGKILAILGLLVCCVDIWAVIASGAAAAS